MIILDLDGTISDDSWRLHLLDPPNYHDYNRMCQFDGLINEHLFDDRGVDYAILTARPIAYKVQTIWWLQRFKVPYRWLLMRPDGCLLPSPEAKRKQLKELDLMSGGAEIIAAYDDRPDVIEMYLHHGVPAHLISGGSHETRRTG